MLMVNFYPIQNLDGDLSCFKGMARHYMKPSNAQHCLLPEPSNKLSPTIPNNKGNCYCSQIQYQPSAQACAPQLCYTAIRFMRMELNFLHLVMGNTFFIFQDTLNRYTDSHAANMTRQLHVVNNSLHHQGMSYT